MAKQSTMKSLMLLLALTLASFTAFAQTFVKGTVYEADGQTPAIGATVLQKGTNNGVSSGVDGTYSIQLKGKNPVLIFRMIGCEEQEVKVGSQKEINVTMKNQGVALDDVVVTALGISREQKALGYAVSKVNNEDLTATSSGNWLNSLNGKVAGLQLSSAGTGPISSARVVLRGEQSLSYGNNEALFVIDGVPVSTGAESSGSGSTYSNNDAPVDFGNAASDLNPEDIESVTVLKGPSATALYGSRAANGAIVITTKSGRSEKGLGISVNSSVVFEKASYFPEFQNVYGPGSDMGYKPYSHYTVTGDNTSNIGAMSSNYSRYAYGEKFDPNKLRYQYASKNWETGEFTALPFVYADDWYTGIFETGSTFNNTVTLSGSNGKGTNTRVSITDARNNWIMPNTGYEKQSVSISFNSPLNKWLDFATKVNYIHKASDNMPVSGYSANNPLYLLAWGYTCNPISVYKEEYEAGRFNAENYASGALVNPSTKGNPYRQLYEQTNAVNKDRVYGNATLKIKFPLKGLTLDLRSGLDINNEFRQIQKPYLSSGYDQGYYREQTIRDYEYNHDFLLRYINNDLFDKRLGLTAAFGGNNMTRKKYRSYITLTRLGVEGVYNANNTPEGYPSTPYNYRSKKVINSFYGMVSLSWDNAYYLDVTGRNDWSSSLAPGNWSFFYPSVSASILVDRALKIKNDWLDMAKVRLSWANVGNDTDPYTLLDAYSASGDYPGGYSLPGGISNYNIKPENVESWEVGLEMMFLKNRFSIDAAYYDSRTTNQIISATTDPIIGASSKKINAGEIRNHGIELSAHITPIKTKDFTWSMDLNWARNWNKLVSYLPGWDPETPLQLANNGTTIGNRVYIYSYVGKEMNVIYGKGYQRAPEGATDAEGNDVSGMILVNEKNGYPILDTQANRKIGRVAPMWRGGMSQHFTYKNFSLNLQFTAQMGGHCFSVTHFALAYQGKLKNSLPGRYDGLVVEGVNATTNADGTVSYKKNTTVTENVSTYYSSYKYIRDNVEENTFKTDFLKLKEARLDDSVPSKWIKKTKVFKGASLGVWATNIFCITSFPQYDPETGAMNGAQITGGIEAMSFPMTRSYGVNLKFSL